MATARTIARTVLLVIALGALALLGACGGDGGDGEDGEFRSSGPPTMPVTYNNHGVSFTYPEDWAVTEDQESDGQVEIRVESPTGSVIVIYPGPDSVSYEVPGPLQPEDEAAIEAIGDQVVHEPPQLDDAGY
jgi:hypothetical protein